MKISEKTIIKVLVNLKCLGYMGKCVKRFPFEERKKILNILQGCGLIDEHCVPTIKALPIISKNLHLCEK